VSITVAARAAVINANVLNALVPYDPSGSLALYADVWAPSSAPKTYVLLNSRTFPVLGQVAMREGVLEVDVFLEGPSQKKAIQIRDAIINVLDSARLEDPDGGDLFRLGELGTDAPAPTDDPAIARRQFAFPFRWWRAAHLTAKS
jgi:hypothetical protein